MTREQVDSFFTENWTKLETKTMKMHEDLSGKGNYSDIMQEVYLRMIAKPEAISNPEAYYTRLVANEIKWPKSMHNFTVMHSMNRERDFNADDLYFDDLEDKIAFEENYMFVKSVIESYKQRGLVERALADLVLSADGNMMQCAKKAGIKYNKMIDMIDKMKGDMTKEMQFMKGLRKRMKDYIGVTPGPYLIAGCGPSIEAVKQCNLSSVTVIGCNDSAAHIDIDYHVVIDPISGFNKDRAQVIENTESMALFTHLRPNQITTKTDMVVDVCFCSDRGFYPDHDLVSKSNNSPFVAACIAIKLGATSLCFAGVDIVDHPNFQGVSKQNMTKTHYADLIKWCVENGIKVYNLGSPDNIFKGIPGVTHTDYEGWISEVWK